MICVYVSIPLQNKPHLSLSLSLERKKERKKVRTTNKESTGETTHTQQKEIRAYPIAKSQWSPGYDFSLIHGASTLRGFLNVSQIDTIGFLLADRTTKQGKGGRKKGGGAEDCARGENKRAERQKKDDDEEEKEEQRREQRLAPAGLALIR